MVRKTKTSSLWKLTILRNGDQGLTERLEDAEFKFGRREGELSRSPVCRAPSGVLSVIRKAELEEQAMESGVVIEMSRREIPGWMCFGSVATLTKTTEDPDFPGMPLTRTRGLYESEMDDSTLTFIDLTPSCYPDREMPARIWMRASELTMNRIQWALNNEIYKTPSSRQRTLHDWFEFQSKNPPCRPEEFKMPGPVW